MSGQKSGHVEVDHARLAAARRESERREQEELSRLQRVGAQLDEANKRRLALLQQRAQQRAEREAARLRALEARLRQRALAAHARVVAQVEAAIAQRAGLEASHPGISLPSVPAVIAQPMGESAEVLANTAALESQLMGYQHAQDNAINQWRQHAAAASASDDTQALMARFRASPVRRVEDLIPMLDQDSTRLHRLGNKAKMSLLVQKARADLDAAQGDSELMPSEDTADALEAVMASTTVSAAQVALARFRVCIETDREALRATQQIEAGRVERERAARDTEEQAARAAEKRQAVTDAFRSVLEDLGHKVSEFEGVAQQGVSTLLALDGGHPDHAWRVDFDDAGGFRSEAVRLVDGTPTHAGAIAESQRVAEDHAYDEGICSEALQKVLETVRERSSGGATGSAGPAIKMKLTHRGESGAAPLNVLSREHLEPQFRRRSRTAAEQQAPKARTRAPKR